MSSTQEGPKEPRWRGLSHVRIDKREAVSGFKWSLLFNVVNKFVLPLAMNAIVVRVLGPEIVGPYSILYAIFAASDVLRDFGLSQTYMRDQEMTSRKEASYMALGILQGLIPAAILFAFREPFAAYYGEPALSPLLVWICGGLLINGFWTIPKAKVLKLGRIRESGARETVANVLQVILSVWMVFNGYTYMALVFPLFVNCVLNVAITYGLAPVTHFRFDVGTMGTALRSAASTLGASVLYNLYIQSDKFVIGKLGGLDPMQSKIAVGLYGQAQGLAQKPMQLLSMPMMAPLQAAFSQNSENPAKIGSIYGRALAAALMFIVPLYAIAMVAAEPVTLLILGAKWEGSVPLVQICSVFFAARTVGTIGGTALVAGGKAKFAMASWLVGYATAIIGCWIAAGSHSVHGFAWAFSAGAVAVYGIHTLFALKWYPPDAAAISRLRSSCIIAFCTSLAVLCLYFLPFSPWLNLAIACALGPAIHLTLAGRLLAGRSTEYLSISGAKRLLRSL